FACARILRALRRICRVRRPFRFFAQGNGIFFGVPALAILALLLGAGLAIAVYKNRATERFDIDVLRRRLYIDDFYQWLISSTQELLARVSAFIDRGLIDAGAVRGAGTGTWSFGALLRLI